MFSNKNTASTYLCLCGARRTLRFEIFLDIPGAERFMLNPPVQTAGQEVPQHSWMQEEGRRKWERSSQKDLGGPEFLQLPFHRGRDVQTTRPPRFCILLLEHKCVPWWKEWFLLEILLNVLVLPDLWCVSRRGCNTRSLRWPRSWRRRGCWPTTQPGWWRQGGRSSRRPAWPNTTLPR